MSIKVMHLIDSGGLYGAEAVLLNLVEEQVKSDLQPLILSAGTPDIEEKPLEKAALERGLPLKKWRMKAGLNLPEAWKILTFAKQEGIQILHSHGYKFNLLMGIWPKFVRKIPLIATVHGYVAAEKYSKMWVYQQLDRQVIKRLNATVFVSGAMKHQLAFKGLNLRNAHVINNGINIDRESSKMVDKCDAEYLETIEGAYPVIGAIGRLAVEKGFEHLIQAFEALITQFPQAKLVIIGDGYHYSVLHDLVRKSPANSQIVMLGFRNPIYPYLKTFNVYVMPSLTEGLPMGLLEAVLAKVPVIASSVGGIPEVLANGEGGVLIPPCSPQEICAGISNILSHPERSACLIDRAVKQLIENFTSTVMSEKYFNVYKEVITEEFV